MFAARRRVAGPLPQTSLTGLIRAWVLRASFIGAAVALGAWFEHHGWSSSNQSTCTNQDGAPLSCIDGPVAERPPAKGGIAPAIRF